MFTFPFTLLDSGIEYPLTKSIDFGGVDEYIDTQVTTDLTAADFTLNLWVKDTGGTMTYAISQTNVASPYASDWIAIQASNAFWLKSQTVGNTTTLTDGNWHMMTTVWDNSAATYEYFEDGVSIGTSGTAVSFGGINSIKIGTRGDATTSFNVGKVTAITIHKSKLTSGNITSLYNSGVPIDPFSVSAPNHYWSFNHPEDDATHSTGRIIDSGTDSAGTNGVPTNTEAGDIVTDAP